MVAILLGHFAEEEQEVGQKGEGDMGHLFFFLLAAPRISFKEPLLSHTQHVYLKRGLSPAPGAERVTQLGQLEHQIPQPQ